MDMPPDPCLPADAAGFGAAMFILYGSLMAGGFPEQKAIEIIARVVFLLSMQDDSAGTSAVPET